MSTQTPVAADDPLMIAWEALKQTEEYQNAVHWTIEAKNNNEADGELWFAFEAGWNTRQTLAPVGERWRQAIANMTPEERDELAAANERFESLIKNEMQELAENIDLTTKLRAAESEAKLLREALGNLVESANSQGPLGLALCNRAITAAQALLKEKTDES